MPSRNSKGQYVSDDDSAIHLPSFGGLLKILVLGIVIFPWYAIISNKNLSSSLFNYVIGQDFCECPFCPLENSTIDSTTPKRLFKEVKCECPKCKCPG